MPIVRLTTYQLTRRTPWLPRAITGRTVSDGARFPRAPERAPPVRDPVLVRAGDQRGAVVAGHPGTVARLHRRDPPRGRPDQRAGRRVHPAGAGTAYDARRLPRLGTGTRPARAQPAAPAAGDRGGTRGARHGVHLHRRAAAVGAAGAGRPVLPLAVPDPGLLVAGAPVLAVGGAQRPVAAADGQGGRRPHREPGPAAAGRPGLRGGTVRRVHS